jgi:integral membrane protein
VSEHRDGPGVDAALARYRLMAYVVGVVLLLLVLVAMPVKYAGGQPALVSTVGPVHGFLYIVYLLAAFDLARRCGWPLGRTLVVLLAGTVPFLSFVVERRVTARLRSRSGAPG